MNRTEDLPEIKDGYLYHFTTAESLIKILSDMTLNASLISRMNDLNECDIDLNIPNSIDRLKIKKYIQNHIRLISFTKNFLIGTICQYGYNHPRMWAQYANNNSGACIVIKEINLLNVNKELLNGLKYRINDVKYENPKYDNEFRYIDAMSFVENCYEQIFFKKNIDWKQEDERRFFCIDGPEKLSISGCVDYIILGNNYKNEDYHDLVNMIVKKNIKLKPHDFTRQTNVLGNVLALDDSSLFLDHLKNIHSKSADYLANLKMSEYELKVN